MEIKSKILDSINFFSNFLFDFEKLINISKRKNKDLELLYLLNNIRNSIAHQHKFQHFLMEEKKDYLINKLKKENTIKLKFKFFSMKEHINKILKESSKNIDKLKSLKVFNVFKRIKTSYYILVDNNTYPYEARLYENIILLFFN